MTRSSLALVLPFALALSATNVAAQATGVADDGTRFTWNGTVPAGAWIIVRNMNGPIAVKPAAGRTAEISAVRRPDHGGDLKMVHFTTKALPNGGMLVCALWGDNADCDEDSYHSHNDGDHGRRNNVEVEFTVSLPAGVNVRVGSVNGDVEVAGATGEVGASTVNGDVRAVSTGGPVSASTVNGDLRASMRTLGSGDLRYNTVNGSIQLDLPASLSADVELRTVNGGFETDFPMTLTGKVSPRHLSGKIGTGGRALRATTVNGSITLRKSS